MLTGKAKKETPRWRRKQPQPPGQVITFNGRVPRKLQQDLRAAARAHAAAAQPHQAPLPAREAFRFRYHLVPFWWLTGLLAAGLGCHAAKAVPLAFIAAAGGAVGIVLFTRGLSPYAQRHARIMAALTALLVPALALMGPYVALPVTLGCWALVTLPWISRYHWRPQPPQAPPDTTDAERWAALAAKRKWSGYLGEPRHPAAGVTQYPIILNGAETNIGEVLAHPRPIAAAWNRAMTEAYAEPDPTGVESRGLLTLLTAGTLQQVREWDGHGADETGCAVIGRFADGQNARIRFWIPRDGTRAGLIAGTTGSGKSYLLDLIVRIAIATGFIVPIILDPQEGQSLPQWRGHVPYASGVDECMGMLDGIRSAMLGRSRELASREWVDEDGHPMVGMDFFDPHLTGLPIALIIADEFHMLLKSGGGREEAKRSEQAQLVASDIAKLARKTGVSLWPALQVPSLEEMGSRALRSMLVGCNVVCLRTGERTDAGMIGLNADPSTLPPYFADGTTTTAGLGYVVGPELRQAPARIDMVPRRVRRHIPAVPELDTIFAMATQA